MKLVSNWPRDFLAQRASSAIAREMPDGAYYLAGYAVELALNARIAKGTQRHDFPDRNSVNASHTHNLNELVTAAKLKIERLARAKLDPIFNNNWDLVQQWSEQSRYQRHSADIAEALIHAISDRKHGVMAWIRTYW